MHCHYVHSPYRPCPYPHRQILVPPSKRIRTSFSQAGGLGGGQCKELRVSTVQRAGHCTDTGPAVARCGNVQMCSMFNVVCCVSCVCLYVLMCGVLTGWAATVQPWQQPCTRLEAWPPLSWPLRSHNNRLTFQELLLWKNIVFSIISRYSAVVLKVLRPVCCLYHQIYQLSSDDALLLCNKITI